jgi:hypothetical protein
MLLYLRGETVAPTPRGVCRPGGNKRDRADGKKNIPDQPGSQVRLQARKDRGLQHRELLEPNGIDDCYLKATMLDRTGLTPPGYLFTHDLGPNAVNDNVRHADTQPESIQRHLHGFIETRKT